ncbi:MAG: hypothetical protein JOZ17_14660, partial [Acetobacteraceae bacterium]|nr:hypothetical protein [Acetobacteraceae bacterium]
EPHAIDIKGAEEQNAMVKQVLLMNVSPLTLISEALKSIARQGLLKRFLDQLERSLQQH